MSTTTKIIESHLKRLQALVDVEVHAIMKILSEQLQRSSEDTDAINEMLDIFLEQNSQALDRLRGSLLLNSMIKHGRDIPTGRNQQDHPTKKILLRK